MIVPDINLLLYAHLDAFPEHRAAKRWWEGIVGSDEQVGLAAVSVFGFIRLVTNRKVFTSPMSIEDAIGEVERWLERDNVRFLLPGPRHLSIAFGLLRKLGSGANLTTDVQLASLAIEFQAELHSNDADFARFPQLRWVNPLDDA